MTTDRTDSARREVGGEGIERRTDSAFSFTSVALQGSVLLGTLRWEGGEEDAREAVRAGHQAFAECPFWGGGNVSSRARGCRTGQ